MNFFKKAKHKQQAKQQPAPQKNPEPRSLEEINKTYGELCARAGELQYKITVDTDQLKQINEALRNVNYEAAARQTLDKQAADVKKAEATPEAEVKNA